MHRVAYSGEEAGWVELVVVDEEIVERLCIRSGELLHRELHCDAGGAIQVVYIIVLV